MSIRSIVIVAAALAAPAWAQTPAPLPAVALKLVPAAEPVPALRYRLLPELREQTPGNAVTSYYRAFSPESQSFRKEANWSELYDKAREMPLAELRGMKELAWLRHAFILGEVDRGARRSHCDWQMADRLREDGISMLLPDVQGMRSFGTLLAVRGRLEMADGNFDAADRTFSTMYAMARHIAEGPTLIQGLVGIAMAALANKQLDTWVQTPGSPNLYWALSNLPVPLIDLRTPFQGERIWVDALMPGIREHLRDPKLASMSQMQLQSKVKMIAEFADSNEGEAKWLGPLLAAAKYTNAKKFLAEHGWTAEQIEALPALEAVFMQEIFEYDRLFDEMAKAVNLPYPQCQQFMEKFVGHLQQMRTGSLTTKPVLASLLLPATQKVIIARLRLDRQIAALRVVEAIRLHAAANSGKLPASLESITLVPVPDDPATGKPFEYHATGNAATLKGAVIGGNPASVVNYEITIAR